MKHQIISFFCFVYHQKHSAFVWKVQCNNCTVLINKKNDCLTSDFKNICIDQKHDMYQKYGSKNCHQPHEVTLTTCFWWCYFYDIKLLWNMFCFCVTVIIVILLFFCFIHCPKMIQKRSLETKTVQIPNVLWVLFWSLKKVPWKTKTFLPKLCFFKNDEIDAAKYHKKKCFQNSWKLWK